MHPDEKKFKLRAKDKEARSFRRQAPYRVAEIQQVAAAAPIEQPQPLLIQPPVLNGTRDVLRIQIQTHGPVRRQVQLKPYFSGSSGADGSIFIPPSSPHNHFILNPRIHFPSARPTNLSARFGKRLPAPVPVLLKQFREQGTQTDSFPVNSVVRVSEQSVQTDPVEEEDYIQILATASL